MKIMEGIKRLGQSTADGDIPLEAAVVLTGNWTYAAVSDAEAAIDSFAYSEGKDGELTHKLLHLEKWKEA